jgi:hypothetical protein
LGGIREQLFDALGGADPVESDDGVLGDDVEEIAFDALDLEGAGVSQAALGVLIDEDASGRIEFEGEVEAPGELDLGDDDVGVEELGEEGGVVLDDEGAGLEDVRQVGVEALSDLSGDAAVAASCADDELDAASASALGGVPDGLLDASRGAEQGAVNIEEDGVDHEPRMA